ncbi:MAG: GNAT family N-acetyltransferase, partial [Gemmatimonadota bacterium]
METKPPSVEAWRDRIEIRRARPGDSRGVAELWCDAFPGKRTVGDRMRMLETGGRYGGLDTVLVGTDRAGVAAACKVYRMEQHIAGAALPMMGLAAVAVAPSRRRRGLGARLCVEAIRTAAARGDAVSTLYPFRPEYYERLGWGLVGGLLDYRFHTGSLQRYEEARDVREAVLERDAERIAACYARVASRSNGPITRDRQVWAYRLTGEDLGVRPVDADAAWTASADPKLRAVVYGQDRVSGYALLRYATRAARDEQVLEVRELVAEDERAYRGLLGHIAAQSDQWPHARHFARPGERFGDRLRDPRPPRHRAARSLYFPTARIVRGPMLRIIDVERALLGRRWFDADEDGTAGTIQLTVEDAQRPENDGPWTVRIDGRAAEVARRADAAAGPRVRIATDPPDGIILDMLMPD